MAAAPRKDAAQTQEGARGAKLLEAIRCLMFAQGRALMANPEAWARKELVKAAATDRRDAFSPLRMLRPPLSVAERDEIYRRVDELAPKILKRFFVADPAKAPDDFTFLASLGLSAGRNWRAGCAVCQTDKIMGTTCGCGHTEIAVFRPCGHSLCAVPCFAELFKRHPGGGPLKSETIETVGGAVFTIVGKVDIRGCRGFPCPLCRAVVQSVFRAEDVRPPAGAWTDADAAAFADLCAEERP